MNLFKGLAGLAVFRWIGPMVMKWVAGRSQPPGFDPGNSYPQGGQPQYWPPPDQHQYPGGPPPQYPPPQYPPPPQYQTPTGEQPLQQESLLDGVDDPEGVIGAPETGTAQDGSAETPIQPVQPQVPNPPPQTNMPPPGYAPPPYPQQPYYPQGPGYQQQPPPKKRKRRMGCLVISLFLAALMVGGVIFGLPLARNAFEGLRDRAMSAIGMTTETTVAEAAGFFPVDDAALPTQDVGVRARDNQLSFTVTGVDCGASVSGRNAVGKFCLVRVAVENTGTEPRHFVMGSQWLIDAAGNRHPGVQWVAAGALPDLLEPGSSLAGQIAFDIPVQASVVYVQLHESPFSPGVLIDLR